MYHVENFMIMFVKVILCDFELTGRNLTTETTISKLLYKYKNENTRIIIV